MGFQARLYLLINTHEIGACAVHFVDKSQPRYLIFVGLAPYGLGLGLNPTHRTKHRAGAVEDAQRALDLDGEIYVARCINNIDTMEDNYFPSPSRSMWWQQK